MLNLMNKEVAHLTGHAKGVAELCLAAAVLPVDLCDRTSLKATCSSAMLVVHSYQEACRLIMTGAAGCTKPFSLRACTHTTAPYVPSQIDGSSLD